MEGPRVKTEGIESGEGGGLLQTVVKIFSDGDELLQWLWS